MPEIKVSKVLTSEDRSLPLFREIDELMARIRSRAFELSRSRGFEAGRELDDWLAAERETCWPAGELVERENEFVLEVALAGFEPRDISLLAGPREIVVHATARHEHEEQGKVCWSEFRSNDVFRRVELTIDIDVGKVTATFRNGLLQVVAPKADVAMAGKPEAEAA